VDLVKVGSEGQPMPQSQPQRKLTLAGFYPLTLARQSSLSSQHQPQPHRSCSWLSVDCAGDQRTNPERLLEIINLTFIVAINKISTSGPKVGLDKRGTAI